MFHLRKRIVSCKMHFDQLVARARYWRDVSNDARVEMREGVTTRLAYNFHAVQQPSAPPVCLRCPGARLQLPQIQLSPLNMTEFLQSQHET